MIEVLSNWTKRYLSNPEAVLLTLLIVVGTLLMLTAGKILAPVLAGMVLAYLLDWGAIHLQRLKISRMFAIWIVYLLFIGLLLSTVFFIIPAVWQQVLNLFSELPNMIARIQELLLLLPEAYPSFFSADQINVYINDIRAAYTQIDIATVSRFLITTSLSTIPGFITLIIYFILVPLLVFFFLKDREKIGQWVAQFLPRKRRVLSGVWSEVNQQLGNYIRGKVAEIFIVGIVTYIVFSLMGLQYASLFGVLVGFSVLVPYIGAAVVTLPIALVAYFQWGLSSEFLYILIAYAIIQALDGNVLVPLLYSEAVNLHPVAIIVAVVFFGGLWGFWGVFFAIPLAILIKALLGAWPIERSIS